ncbi:hypothetical protein CXG81DRAFT_19699 [Caulochytrium protostelioides]|uniref:FUN14-domain-containing protein n=1 Tax=Caulochytrium protostelioides TaxID=1555241 RepID=A0A4P9X5C5_9FUNG|nr:hypothetical protein CXG81DRAFT_19699 [Caulochytrium protostelioides]|eukprot:RKP00337.1 hypothetical protein CXG81DRAFT_19699 [Caulochytrium protostelioides]
MSQTAPAVMLRAGLLRHMTTVVAPASRSMAPLLGRMGPTQVRPVHAGATSVATAAAGSRAARLGFLAGSMLLAGGAAFAMTRAVEADAVLQRSEPMIVDLGKRIAAPARRATTNNVTLQDLQPKTAAVGFVAGFLLKVFLFPMAKFMAVFTLGVASALYLGHGVRPRQTVSRLAHRLHADASSMANDETDSSNPSLASRVMGDGFSTSLYGGFLAGVLSGFYI